MDIKLTFINDAPAAGGVDIVICGTPPQGNVVAWRLIQQCAPGDSYPFVYPDESTIGYEDSYGNHTRQLTAQLGQQFVAVRTPDGDTIERVDAPGPPAGLVLSNRLPEGAITVGIYKDGLLFASLPGVTPQQEVMIELPSVLWIGAASQIEQGEVFDPAALADITTQLSLPGIASADIVMTGGGNDPLVFTLTNIVNA